MSSNDGDGSLTPSLLSQNETTNSSTSAPPETDLQFLVDQNLGIGVIADAPAEDSSHVPIENSMEITPVSTPKRIVKRKKTIPQEENNEPSLNVMEDSPAKNLRRRRSLHTPKPVNYNEESDQNNSSAEEEENETMVTPKSRTRRRKSDGEKPSPSKKLKSTPTKEWKAKQEEEIQKMKDYFKRIDSLKLKSGNEVNNDNEFTYL